VSPTYNLRVWCEENGELGERILEEWDDPEKGPEEVTRGSPYRARWKCRECGRTFHTTVKNRTSKSSGPTGCKGCLDMVATETHNLKLFCDDSRGRLAHLPGEWNHRSKRMEDFTPASREGAVEVREVRERVELKSEHAGAIPVTCALGALAHSLHDVLHGYWRG
jgi:hypothetical protein